MSASVSNFVHCIQKGGDQYGALSFVNFISLITIFYILTNEAYFSAIVSGKECVGEVFRHIVIFHGFDIVIIANKGFNLGGTIML